MQPPPTIYRAYLLRMWQVHDTGLSEWRASVEDAQSRERIGFTNLQQLIDFISTEDPASTATDWATAGDDQSM